MPSISYSDLFARISAASGEVIEPGGRTSPGLIVSWMNAELEQYHQDLTEFSDQLVTRTTLSTSADTTVGADGWPANQRVTLPTDFQTLHQASIYDGQRWARLQPFPESERPDELWQPAVPNRCRVSKATDGTTVLRLLRPADGVYTIEVLYLPKFTVLAEGQSATIDLLAGGDDWIVYGTTLRILQGTGVQEVSAFNAAQAFKADAIERVKRFASKMDRSGPTCMRETDRDARPEQSRYWY